MGSSRTQYDVIIVGASVAGTATAMLFAQQGLRVALIERHKEIDAYKKVCTHFIQPSATPTIKRLGLAEAIEQAGGLRNGGRAWARWGWYGPGVNDESYGYNVRRQVLDPLLRRHAAATPGVDFRPGTSVQELLHSGDRLVGIKANGPDGQSLEFRAQLVVGADGRYSRTAELAGIPSRLSPNNRFMYFAYYRNLTLATGRSSQVWYLDPEVAYAFPNDNGFTLVACALPKSRLAEFKQDVQGNFVKFFDSLPDGPNLRAAEQTSKVIGMLEMPNVARATTAPGLALVGDAALTSDPVWGNGMAWAFQSAEWLVDATAEALRHRNRAEIAEGLEHYRQKHQTELTGRFARDVDFSRARRFNFLERLFYAAAARDPEMAQYTGPHSIRLANVRQFPPLKAIAKAVWVNLSYQYPILRSIHSHSRHHRPMRTKGQKL